MNPIDAKLRGGIRPSGAIDEPRRVGSDGAGVVTAVGEDVDGFRVGDPVVFFGVSGAYASDIVVKAGQVHVRPPQVSAVEGAALGVPSERPISRSAPSASGRATSYGGSGAAGQAVIQFAVLWGATVSRHRPSALRSLRALGARPSRTAKASRTASVGSASRA